MTQKDLFKKNHSSSQVDIRVNLSQSQVGGEAKKILATSIRTSKELLNKSDPLGQFTKMFMGTSQWDLTRFSFKWTSKGQKTSEQSQGASRSEYSQTISNSESLGRRGGNGEQCGTEQRKILEDEQGRSSLGSEVEGCSQSHGNLSDTSSERVQRLWSSWEQEPDTHGQSVISVCQSQRPPQAIWKVEPNVDRVVDGIPKRVDRIKGLGNAINRSL